MAESPAHKFGQIIGELLEAIVRPQLEVFCRSQQLYLDHQKKNRPVRNSRKVTWADLYGNAHDLDFVIERGGTDAVIGRPVAFIEVAWRRYTKHSRNKAQEIQGAILPLAEKYKWSNPFLGVVLAGVFTSGSIEQLHSLGFNVLHFPYETLVQAFQLEGVDILFDEGTADNVFRQTAAQIEDLSTDAIGRIQSRLIEANHAAIDEFFAALNRRLSRYVTRVVITPLYGRINEFAAIEDALCFLDQHFIYEGSLEFRKYEIYVEFSNGDRVQASFEAKIKVTEFLEFVSRQ